MIDLHCHVLPGIDDGPATFDESLMLARGAVAAGTHTLVATPHVSWRYQNDAETIAELVGELRARLAGEGIDLDVRAGAELAMTRLPELDESELARLSLGGGRWLLVEPPFAPVVSGLAETLTDLKSAGRQVLLAHPERCAAFHRDPQMLTSIVRSGVLTSITAGSLVGRFGEKVRRFALELVREELVHNVASDAHDATKRAPGMGKELEQAGLAPLAEWLTAGVPGAILAGGEVPPRPAVSLDRPRGSRRWLRRR